MAAQLDEVRGRAAHGLAVVRHDHELRAAERALGGDQRAAAVDVGHEPGRRGAWPRRRAPRGRGPAGRRPHRRAARRSTTGWLRAPSPRGMIRRREGRSSTGVYARSRTVRTYDRRRPAAIALASRLRLRMREPRARTSSRRTVRTVVSFFIAIERAERREIVLADQVRGGRAHRLDVQDRDRPAIRISEWIRETPVVNVVMIDLPLGRKARVKRARHAPRGSDLGYDGRETRAEGSEQFIRSVIPRGIEMEDLAKCVDARIGARPLAWMRISRPEHGGQPTLNHVLDGVCHPAGSASRKTRCRQ